eukprot:Opistho-2@48975
MRACLFVYFFLACVVGVCATCVCVCACVCARDLCPWKQLCVCILRLAFALHFLSFWFISVHSIIVIVGNAHVCVCVCVRASFLLVSISEAFAYSAAGRRRQMSKAYAFSGEYQACPV